MNLFAESDHDQLTADPAYFDRASLMDEHGDWGHQLLRAATALEILTQITKRTDDVLLKGGTLLQNSFGWPPARASVDLDLETRDSRGISSVLDAIVQSFAASELRVNVRESPLPGFAAEMEFPRASGPDWALRIDALETKGWPQGSHPWRSIPEPWEDAEVPTVPPKAMWAAQKLLMAAKPPYGRDLSSHLGRQSMIKDQFNLSLLGTHPIEGEALLRAVTEDIQRKSAYLDEAFDRDHLLAESAQRLQLFAHPPVDDTSRRGRLWRAHGRVQSTIRTAFTQIDLRTTAGCSHHAITSLEHNDVQWTDTWRPVTDRERRSAWEDSRIQPVIEVSDDYGPVPGPREAWAKFARD